MGLSDELEALRAKGSVKQKSSRLSIEVTKHGSITTPESIAASQKLKSAKEKQALEDAKKSLHHGASGRMDLNLLYKKLIDEQRMKKREAELNLREWRKAHVGKNKDVDGGEEGGSSVEDGDMPPQPPDAPFDEESAFNIQALEMLPKHIIDALKTKYDTDNPALALEQALKEESSIEEDGEEGSGGGGMLKKLMEVTALSDEEGVSEAVVRANSTEEDGVDIKVEEAKQLPVEEQPSTEDDEYVKVPSLSKSKPDLSNISNEDRIQATKRFYNTHTQEYIDKVSSQPNLTPTSHRDTFLTQIQTQQNLINANDTITILELGCGYGRDTKYFSELGHVVLGIDYSYEMLSHAKQISPKAHFLNIDIRQIKNVLVDTSIDGIWCNATLLHLPKDEAMDVLKAIYVAVKVGGVLFINFKVKNDDNNNENGSGEVFEADERYTDIRNKEEVDINADDTRRKLYSYYTKDEVRTLLESSGWDILEIVEDDDLRKSSDYVEHSWVYAFATRRKE